MWETVQLIILQLAKPHANLLVKQRKVVGYDYYVC